MCHKSMLDIKTMISCEKFYIISFVTEKKIREGTLG